MDKKPENYFDGTQFRLACHRCVGARDPCAGYSPPGGARGPCAGYSPPGGGARGPCAGYSPPGGARVARARATHRRALRLPGRLFGAFRRYSAGRGQAAAAPLSAPHKGRVERPLPLCYPHLCLARSYQAHASTSGGELLNCARPTVRGAAELSFSLRPFFKKAGKAGENF